ncbi:BACK domain-containing protein [Caenorhabditis elegans]|uniref:BACK domain-containing protein n=1 Tax=Caenorhabditis elegans TaxID=6239 RepID=H9G313_CAEEL|nr:BACK domain-containing protein [Caenorhabditis elegans]CCG28220.1 BACK domain-containing protein [Caenorhabditis elegans]|eukprot:NP_001256857.1 Uncharacterized protein CELE_C25F9.14 [Caenorhabditis elegans]
MIMLSHQHEQIVYDFDVFLTKAKEMSEQDPPDIVIFSNLIWGQHAQEKLREIVLDTSTDDAIVCESLYSAWTFAKHCRKNAMRYINKELRNEILLSVADMEAYMNATDIEKIKEKIPTSGLQIKHSQNNVKIGNCQFSYNKVAY